MYRIAFRHAFSARVRVFAAFLSSIILFPIEPVPARAEASGPDTWNVAGVRSDDVLNVHAEASARSRTIGSLPHDAKGIRNLGCTGTPTFAQWTAMSPPERERSARARWCRISHNGINGWVAGRFLTEGAAPAAATPPRSFGPWTIRCNPTCALEQIGVGTISRTLLRLAKREGSNAEVTIERAGLPRSGTLSIYMDGKTISAGPIAPFAKAGGGRIVMPPDDITQGLVRQMSTHKNMVLTFPGEARGVEIHLDRFQEAWQALR